MMTNPHIMKIYYDDKTKRCTLPKDFKELTELVLKNFTKLTDSFEIYYIDEEKEFILIENHFDYENALAFLRQGNLSTLKITIRNPSEKFDVKQIAKYIDNSTLGSSIEFSSSNKKQDDNESITPLKCETCQRRFYTKTSHIKHSQNCTKVFGTKRIPFDSKKQREIPMISQRDITLYAQLDKMNARISNDMTNLSNVMKIWKKACNKLNSRIVSRQGRAFNELFVEINKKECANCHRQFNDISYLKHAKNCVNVTTKRNPFDSRKQRIIDSEHAGWMRRKEILESGHGKEMMMEMSSRSGRWRRLSERWRVIMRISRVLYRKK